jgi:hypothetical protein
MSFLRKNGPKVKGRAVKALFFLLLLCFSLGVLGQSGISAPGSMGAMGFAPGGGANSAGRSLGFSKSNPHTPDGPGGVHFQATAVPAGRWEAVSLYYAPGQPDGQRLFIRFKDYGPVPSELYDWQLVPVAGYADSQNLACVTLLDNRIYGEENLFEEAVRKYNEGLPEERKLHRYWANFHSSLADTLIGFNTFLVDAMFISPVKSSALYGHSAVVPRDVPGYNDGPRFSDMNAAQNNFFIDIARRRGRSSYVYTDYGTAITYDLRNGRIVFDGYPSYQFHRRLIENNEVKEVVTLDDLNEYVKANRTMVNSLNPVIFKTAEMTAHWAALFRAIKARNPEAWKVFLGQIKSAAAEPVQRTPRYWLPRGVPPELEPYLPYAQVRPDQVQQVLTVPVRPLLNVRRIEAPVPELRRERPLDLRALPGTRIELRKDRAGELRLQRAPEALQIQRQKEQKEEENQ